MLVMLVRFPPGAGGASIVGLLSGLLRAGVCPLDLFSALAVMLCHHG